MEVEGDALVPPLPEGGLNLLCVARFAAAADGRCPRTASRLKWLHYPTVACTQTRPSCCYSATATAVAYSCTSAAAAPTPTAAAVMHGSGASQPWSSAVARAAARPACATPVRLY